MVWRSRNVRAFGLTSLLNDTASEMAYWIIPAFLTSLGAGPLTLGVIEGIAESVASALKLGSGYLTDRLARRKPLIVWGYVIANAVKPLLALCTAWWQVLGIRFGDRVSKGMRSAPRDVMLAESVEKSELGSAFGLVQAMDSAGAILGPLLALWLLRGHGMRTVFWVAGIPGALCVMVVMVLVREERTRARVAAAEPHEKRGFSLHVPRGIGAGFWSMLAIVTLFSVVNSSDMFLVLRAKDVGIAVALAPLLGLVFNAVYTAASWPAGWLSDRIPKTAVAAAGYFIFAVVYLVFGLAQSTPAWRAGIWAAMALYGFFYALTNAVLRALVMERAQPEVRGAAVGIFYFTTSIAILIASVMTGWLWKEYGAKLPFCLSAAVGAICAVMLLLSRTGHPPSGAQEAS
jgi:MFS family permease